MIYHVSLKRYAAIADKPLVMGTYDSYGNEQISIERDDCWSDLSIVAVFNAPNGSSTAVMVDDSNFINVPAEATAEKHGRGDVTFKGVGDDNRIITVKLRYTVVNRGNVDCIEAVTPSATLVDQILQAADGANKSASKVYEELPAIKELSEQAATNAAKAEDAAARAEASSGTKITSITNSEIDYAISSNS